MLKVAVCFAGQFRFAEQVLPSYQKHLLQHYDCDVFIHTWNYDDKVGQPYVPTQRDRGIIQPNYREIIQLFKPKRVIVEKPLYGHEEACEYGKRNQMQMYSKKAAFDLAAAKGEYDCYLIARTDIQLESKHEIPEDKLDHLSCWYCGDKDQKIGDQVFHGNKQVMHAATHGTYDQLMSKGIWKEPNILWWCEHYLWHAMQDFPKRKMGTKFRFYRQP